jgi:xanthosine utilization system XapX-like protein
VHRSLIIIAVGCPSGSIQQGLGQIPSLPRPPAPPRHEARPRLPGVRPPCAGLRNTLLIGLAVVAVIVALATLGLDIGPLLAGLGVVGIAIGFGAQSLVRDVISGRTSAVASSSVRSRFMTFR